MEITIYQCSLPFPPSVNAAFGQRPNHQRFKSDAYKAWLASCPDLVLPECGMIIFPVRVVYRFFHPDKRKRDITNYLKLPEDFLVAKDVIEDDNQNIVVGVAAIFQGYDKENPRVEIEIYDAR